MQQPEKSRGLGDVYKRQVINKGATAREVGAELTIAAPIGEILGQIKVQ